jgi:hypothetical protein
MHRSHARSSILATCLFALLVLAVGCGSEAMTDSGANEIAEAPPEGGGSDDGSESAGEGDESSSSDSDDSQEGSESDKERKSGQLTAGEWRDLDNWAFWLDLFDDGQSEQSEQQQTSRPDFGQFESTWKLFTRERYAVRVVSGDKPVVDARVELTDDEGEAIWRARTDNRGRAELYEGFTGGQTPDTTHVHVEAEGRATTLQDIAPTDSERLTVEFASRPEPSPNLDVMFTIDTTGSMGDELSYLQAELADVMKRSQQEAGGNLDLRLSVNAYRDQSDDYVVRANPFRTDVSQAVSDLEGESAGGGGDYPEAVHDALTDAIEKHDWRDSAKARLLFLVLDAPPHDEEAARRDIQEATKLAAEKGIRIIPVAGSGVDKSTEYILRALGILTGGSYTFLTDHSGIGGDHIDPTIGDYDVRYLNNLLVDIIARYAGSVETVGGGSQN